MTISTRTLGCLATVAAFALFTPAAASAAPEVAAAVDEEADEELDEDVDAQVDEVSDRVDVAADDDKDIDIEVDGDDDDDKGCTIATGVGQNIGGLLCTLGLLGWQLRRRRAA